MEFISEMDTKTKILAWKTMIVVEELFIALRREDAMLFYSWDRGEEVQLLSLKAIMTIYALLDDS
jgi:hypothetical protein